jgi:hypothetical protein
MAATTTTATTTMTTTMAMPTIVASRTAAPAFPHETGRLTEQTACVKNNECNGKNRATLPDAPTHHDSICIQQASVLCRCDKRQAEFGENTLDLLRLTCHAT